MLESAPVLPSEPGGQTGAGWPKRLVTSCAIEDIVFDYSRRWLVSSRLTTALSPKQSDLLVYLILVSPRAVPTDELARVIWGHRVVAQTATYRQVIRQLREKLAVVSAVLRIHNQPGRGYRLTAASEGRSAKKARVHRPTKAVNGVIKG